MNEDELIKWFKRTANEDPDGLKKITPLAEKDNERDIREGFKVNVLERLRAAYRYLGFPKDDYLRIECVKWIYKLNKLYEGRSK